VGSGQEAAHTIHESAGAKQPGLARLLAYDEVRRASLLDGLFLGDDPLDPLAPWSTARWASAAARFRSSVEEQPERGLAVTLSPDPEPDVPLAVEKRLLIRDATVEASYRLSLRARAAAAWTGSARWAVQWNLALTAGDAPGRYLSLPGRPALGSSGRVPGVSEVALVDEWIGVEARLAIRPAAELAWGPVETVSVSEGGFERIHQGLALLLVWPLTGDGREPWELRTALTLASR
jgi:alpha-amylase